MYFVWMHDFSALGTSHTALMSYCCDLKASSGTESYVILQETASPLNLIWNCIKFILFQSHMLHPACSFHGFPQMSEHYKMFFYPWRPYLEEPRNVTVQKGAEPLGISIVSGENGGVFVSKVTAGSIAHQARLEYGDQLLEVQNPPPFN